MLMRTTRSGSCSPVGAPLWSELIIVSVSTRDGSARPWRAGKWTRPIPTLTRPLRWVSQRVATGDARPELALRLKHFLLNPFARRHPWTGTVSKEIGSR